MSRHEGGGFGNGLMVGMVLGAVLVLLFTTKKGRKILRVLSEDGFEKLKDWEKILDELELDDDLETEEDFIPTNGNHNGYTHADRKVKPTMRRLFRGIHRTAV